MYNIVYNSNMPSRQDWNCYDYQKLGVTVWEDPLIWFSLNRNIWGFALASYVNHWCKSCPLWICPQTTCGVDGGTWGAYALKSKTQPCHFMFLHFLKITLNAEPHQTEIETCISLFTEANPPKTKTKTGVQSGIGFHPLPNAVKSWRRNQTMWFLWNKLAKLGRCGSLVAKSLNAENG